MEWWLDTRWTEGRQRAQRYALIWAGGLSLAMHLTLVAVMLWVDVPPPAPLGPVVTVDLLASLPSAAPASRPAPAPAARPRPKKVLLPKEAAPLSTKPKPVAPSPEPRPQPRPEELEYEDALATLRQEMGEVTSPSAPAEPTADASPAAGRASPLSAELQQWVIATRRHVRQSFVTPPEFRGQGLVAELEVRLTATGEVLGTPRVVRSSGNPFWDDNAVRALRRASPLPAPPEAGRWPFSFRSEDRG